jgi:radical SAM protein with 4Fe4S-binding SPASM domain
MNLASRLTPRRLINHSSILLSYQYSRMAGTPSIQGLPISISFEPTTSCNLRCPECPSGLRSFTRPTGMLDQSLFRNTIDQLASTLSYLTFYFQGEPYLHPSFLDMVQYASERNVYTATSTNAHYLKEENAKLTVQSGLDRLIISIDGTTQDTYQSYRVGGSLDKVIEGTKNIIAAKKELRSRTPHVVFQFLVVKPNEHQIDDVYRIANEKYSRYRRNTDNTFSIKNELLNHCWKMWQGCVITWDGRIVPCCFDKDAHYVMGDLTKNSFEEIWRGKAYHQFRSTLLRSRNEIEMCKNCTEGTRVWA